MWTTEQLAVLKTAIEQLKAESRIVVVDKYGDGSLCKWLLDTFPVLATLYGAQECEFDHDKNERCVPQSEYLACLPPSQFQALHLSSVKVLERLGGRRFDFVVNAEPFTTLDEAIAWADLFAPRTTGKVFCIADGQVRSMPGTCAIPVRSEPVRHELAVADIGDPNAHVLYVSR